MTQTAHAPMTGPRLRPAEPGDAGWLRALTMAQQRDELLACGWPATALDALLEQQHRLREHGWRQAWPDHRHWVLTVAGEDAGRVWLGHSAQGLHLIDLLVAPAFRGRGLGRWCLAHWQNEAAHAGLPLSLVVRRESPARRLYERMGFSVCADDGGLDLQMVWQTRDQALSAQEGGR